MEILANTVSEHPAYKELLPKASETATRSATQAGSKNDPY
jgi:hypothetical protein